MVEKDYKLYGTKILNLKTQEIGLLICLWENKYADKKTVLDFFHARRVSLLCLTA